MTCVMHFRTKVFLFLVHLQFLSGSLEASSVLLACAVQLPCPLAALVLSLFLRARMGVNGPVVRVVLPFLFSQPPFLSFWCLFSFIVFPDIIPPTY